MKAGWRDGARPSLNQLRCKFTLNAMQLPRKRSLESQRRLKEDLSEEKKDLMTLEPITSFAGESHCST